LTRRTFSGTKVVQNLAEQRNATIAVADANKVKYADLNIASENYVNAIGKAAAIKYNLADGDNTHLNEWGGVVFSRIVSDIIVAKYPEFEPFVKKNATLSALIKAGKAA
jgi:hypothetical protein